MLKDAKNILKAARISIFSQPRRLYFLRSCSVELINEFLASGTLMSLDANRFLLGFGKRQWIKKPIENKPNFYFPDFFLTESHPWCIHENCMEIDREDLIEILEPHLEEDSEEIVWNNPFLNTFQEGFEELQQKFTANILQKAVPYVMEQSPCQMSKAAFVKSCLSMLNFSRTFPLHLYGFWENGQGMLGATPEILFSLEGHEQRTLRTMACAGTRSERHGSAASLLNDPKELYEHRLVIKGITEALIPFGDVTLHNTTLTQLPGLAHLMTPIELALHQQQSFDSLVHVLHPTPALGAFPKEAGWKWLLNYESKINRVRYGAPAGFINPNGEVSRCLVGIRNVQWNATGMFIGAGCGVIPASVMENEWQEIQTKIRAIKKLLNL